MLKPTSHNTCEACEVSLWDHAWRPSEPIKRLYLLITAQFFKPLLGLLHKIIWKIFFKQNESQRKPQISRNLQKPKACPVWIFLVFKVVSHGQLWLLLISRKDNTNIMISLVAVELNPSTPTNGSECSKGTSRAKNKHYACPVNKFAIVVRLTVNQS